MNFLFEVKRYWNINLKDYKKSICPLLFNLVVVVFMYILLNDIMTETYIVSYCIAWLLLTSQLSLTQELLQDVTNRRIKYFFMGTNSLTRAYFYRYLIVCVKYVVLFFVFVKFMNFVNIIQYDLKIYETILIYMGLSSLFFVNYILTLFIVINKKMLMAINMLKCIILFLFIKRESMFLPGSYLFSNLGKNFFLNRNLDVYDTVIILGNSIIYIIFGYFISTYITKCLKYKLLN